MVAPEALSGADPPAQTEVLGDTVKAPAAFTVTVVVEEELQGAAPMEYVIVCVPAPAAEGLNIPEEEVPGPAHVPPWLTAVS